MDHHIPVYRRVLGGPTPYCCTLYYKSTSFDYELCSSTGYMLVEPCREALFSYCSTKYIPGTWYLVPGTWYVFLNVTSFFYMVSTPFRAMPQITSKRDGEGRESFCWRHIAFTSRLWHNNACCLAGFDRSGFS